MGTIYTRVHECGKEEIIVLNRNYTKEQIREKLSVSDSWLGESRIDEILSKGIYLDEILTIEFKDEGWGAYGKITFKDDIATVKIESPDWIDGITEYEYRKVSDVPFNSFRKLTDEEKNMYVGTYKDSAQRSFRTRRRICTLPRWSRWLGKPTFCHSHPSDPPICQEWYKGSGA